MSTTSTQDSMSIGAIVEAIRSDPATAQALRRALDEAPRPDKPLETAPSVDGLGQRYDADRAAESQRQEKATIDALNRRAARTDSGREPRGWAEQTAAVRAAEQREREELVRERGFTLERASAAPVRQRPVIR